MLLGAGRESGARSSRSLLIVPTIEGARVFPRSCGVGVGVLGHDLELERLELR